MKKRIIVSMFFITLLMISGCGSKSQQADVSVTPPAISVNITRGNYPSMELEVGMWVAWTNVDTVSLPIKIEYPYEEAKGAGTGLSVIDPGTTFSTNFPDAGIFRVYCTDTDIYSTITVK